MYEEEIKAIKELLIRRAKYMNVYDEETTHVFDVEQDGFIYIIVNPLIEDYDSDLRPFQRRNVCAWYKDGKFINGRYVVEAGLYPIRMPFLLARINIETGEIKDGGKPEGFEIGTDIEAGVKETFGLNLIMKT